MKTAPSSVSYVERAIREAEAAVALVTEDALRPPAFQALLRHFLAGGEAPLGATNRPPAQHREKRHGVQGQKRAGPQAYVEELLSEHFFRTARRLNDVRTALGNRGHHVPAAHIGKALQRLCQARNLRRQKRLGADEGAQGYAYTEW